MGFLPGPLKIGAFSCRHSRWPVTVDRETAQGLWSRAARLCRWVFRNIPLIRLWGGGSEQPYAVFLPDLLQGVINDESRQVRLVAAGGRFTGSVGLCPERRKW